MVRILGLLVSLLMVTGTLAGCVTTLPNGNGTVNGTNGSSPAAKADGSKDEPAKADPEDEDDPEPAPTTGAKPQSSTCPANPAPGTRVPTGCPPAPSCPSNPPAGTTVPPGCPPAPPGCPAGTVGTPPNCRPPECPPNPAPGSSMPKGCPPPPAPQPCPPNATGCKPGTNPDGTPPQGGPPSGPPNPTAPQEDPNDVITVTRTGASYTSWAGSAGNGFFRTGQSADLLLSAFGNFNETGGAGLLHHPGGIATDGTRLLVVDVRNNRVLVWNSLPSAGTAPDLVLGQPGFTTNRQGATLDKLNFPIGVATAGGKVFVADAENDRILVWNTFPTTSGQAADFAIRRAPVESQVPLKDLVWPWAVWSNGAKLVVTSTGGSKVFVWNSVPTSGDVQPDLVLTNGGKFGTPRSIGSDGTYLMIGDHNAVLNDRNPGNYFWSTFPTSNVAADFMMVNPQPIQPGQQVTSFTFYGGLKDAAGRFYILGNHGMHVWNQFPTNASDHADLSFFGGPVDFGPSSTGDAGGLAIAGSRLFLSLYNGNKVASYDALPTATSDAPSFVLFAPNLATNTLDTHRVITNPIPVSNGRALFVASDFDRKMYVWKTIPDTPAATPDFVYRWEQPTIGMALHGNALMTVGGDRLYVWNALPLDGEKPAVVLKRIGNLTLADAKGIAYDGVRTVLAMNGFLYVWNGIPNATSNYAFRLEARDVGKITSDGSYLAVTFSGSNPIRIYDLANFSASSRPTVVAATTNLPGHVMAAHGRLFVGDVGFNRVQVWSSVASALAGQGPDVVIGARDLAEREPGLGADELFWPATVWFDGTFLWVGEVKFSGRLLRYTLPAA